MLYECPYCGSLKASENGTGSDVSCCGEVGHARERAQQIHEHDCPVFRDFYMKHALGSKTCPSCLLCGHAEPDRERWAITHMELPDIYICKGCVNAARSTR